MRVCLINPPRIQPKVWGKPSVFPPIPLAYMAAVLEKTNEVYVIDAPTEGRGNLQEINKTTYRVGLSINQIGKKIKLWSPEVVIIEIPFSGWSRTAFEVSSKIKQINSNTIIILYGQHPSARPKACLEHEEIDFVVIGEAENTVLELVNNLKQGFSKLEKIKGLAFIRNNKVVITPARPVIEDLDSLPLPARHLLPMNEYAIAVKENPLRGVIKKPWTIMITSRGCPFSCIFCTHHTVWGRKWRGRSPQNVVAEIEHLVKIYGIKQIDFLDDNMTLDRNRMERICDLIIKKGLHVEWFTPSGVRADTLDESLLRKMKKAGCKKIRLAPESGVQKIVDTIIKKNLDLKSVEKAVRICKKIGLKVGCFFVIGLIGETKDDIKATINFAYKLRQLGADSFIFSIASPIYGTELYQQAKSKGYLRPGFCEDALATAEPLIETPEFSAEDLITLCEIANSVNPTFTRDKIIRAMLNPTKTLKLLLGKT
ncbi:radical SAM protein [Candidatus Bathyarchaeota archaeon]|nr:radical SAM protein [Candidatus Bathyarchaeota archaeon]